MTDPRCSFLPRRRAVARLVGSTVAATCLGLPSLGSAQTAVAAATATYEVVATPLGSLSLCPGESVDILVGINQVIRRGSVASTSSVPYAVVTGSVVNSAIGSLNRVLIGSGGGSSSGYRTVTFTATGIGQTVINFTGYFINNLSIPVSSPGGGSVPAAPTSLTVKVDCKFTISLFGAWQLPGERLLDVLGAVAGAPLVPDAQGNFSTTASMSSTGVWIGGCTGFSRIQRSPVTITGSVGSRIRVNLTFDPVSSVTTEGCVGKSKGGQGQLEPLVLSLSSQGETRDYPHVLRTYVNAAGTTTVVLRRLP
ncbi:MAG: hypothetical protein ACKVZ0_10720 [Gemmatimonadales bacterium]